MSHYAGSATIDHFAAGHDGIFLWIGQTSDDGGSFGAGKVAGRLVVIGLRSSLDTENARPHFDHIQIDLEDAEYDPGPVLEGGIISFGDFEDVATQS